MSTSIHIFRDMEQIEVYMQHENEKKEKEKKKEKKEKKQSSHPKEKSMRHAEEQNNSDSVNPTVIDNTSNQKGDSEFAVPENKIIRFSETMGTQNLYPPLRIRRPVDSIRENTNTPTVNKREEKRRNRTRRGKRAGKGKATVETTNQSYVDFIVNEDPTVTANTTIVQAPADAVNNASTIEIPLKEDSVLTETPAKPEMPLLQDIIQCTAMYLDPQEHVPKVGLVEGRVISYGLYLRDDE